MRITCPNCGAKYEVDADLIPDEGRDVQCSSCGNIWLQLSDGSVEEIATNGTDATPAAPDDPAETDADADAPVEAEAEAESAPAPGGRTKRRELDDDTRRILREEAEREAARRRAARGELETQTELDLPADAEPRARPPRPDPSEAEDGTDEAGTPTRRTPAADDGQPVDPAAFGAISSRPRVRTRSDAARAAASRGDLLPDIEEINSSLAASEPRPEIEDDHAEARQRSGFRRGFVTVLSLTILAIAVYIAAPSIAARVPALELPLRGYVGGVNELRANIDATLQRAATAIGGVGS